MAVSRDSVHAHKAKYGGMYMITFFGSLLPVLTIGGMILNSFNNLATEGELVGAITTHVNAGMHPAAENAIQEVELKSECRWLDDKIESLDNLIYEMQRDGGDADRIHDKEQQLEKYERQYDKKHCANVKY